MKKLVDSTIFKFLLVGIFNTLVGCGTMFLLYNLANCSYWFSSAANYVVGSIVSFFLNKYFTFKNYEQSWKQIVKFAINVAICYLIAYGAAKPIVFNILRGQSIIMQENVAMFTGMCLYTGLNYFGQRFFAFREER